MKVVVFSSHRHDEQTLDKALAELNFSAAHSIHYLSVRLNQESVPLAKGYEVVCAFVNDVVDRAILVQLKEFGIKGIVLRCAGFNNVDLDAAAELDIAVMRVPSYSPHAVAEMAVSLLCCLNRKLIRANNRVHEGNFQLDGLLGFDLHGKTVGVLGTGGIGLIFARIMACGFQCKVIGFDAYPNEEFKKIAEYKTLEEVCAESDIISIHLPLTPGTRHLVNEQAIKKMKKGVIIINTARGPIIDSKALIEGLKKQQIGGVGLDVLEGEESMFFEDRSEDVIENDAFHRLCSFKNVLITGHQAFFTVEALKNIAETTVNNVNAIETGNFDPKNTLVFGGKRLA